jgi:Rrf2 family protein
MMIDIHRSSGDGKPVQLKEVAGRTQLSRGYLEQMVVALKNASLLRGISGRRGGYLLARPADQIRIGEIIEAVIGPIGIVNCVTVSGSCMRSDYCDCHLLWSLVSFHIREDLNAHTLAEMSSNGWRKTMMKKLEPYMDMDGAPASLPGDNPEEVENDSQRLRG